MATEGDRPTRTQKFTEKGLPFAIETKKKAFTDIKRKVIDTERLLTSALEEGSLKSVKFYNDDLSEKMKELNGLFLEISQLDEEGSLKLQLQSELEIVDRSIMMNKGKAIEFIRSHTEEKVRSQAGRTKSSSSASKASWLLKKAEAEAEWREKEVEERQLKRLMESEKRRRQLLLQEELLRDEEKLLNVQADKEKSKVRFEVFDKYHLDSGSDEERGREILDVEEQTAHHKVQEYIQSHYGENNGGELRDQQGYYRDEEELNQISMREDNLSHHQDINHHSDSREGQFQEANHSMRHLSALLQQMAAPEPELEKFEGDPLQYRLFISKFKEMVESRIPDERGRLNRLIAHTKGDPREFIEECVHVSDGYRRALNILENEYGNMNTVAATYEKELRNWPRIPPGDGKALLKFYLFLTKCGVSLSEREYFNELNTQSNLKGMCQKLPTFLQDRWNRKVTAQARDNHRATFDDFCKFIKIEADVANNPIFSKEAMKEERPEIPRRARTQTPGVRRAFVSHLNVRPRCHYCERDGHSTTDCRKFGEIQLQDRRSFINRKRLCYGCLQPVTPQHTVRTCRQKLHCAVCSHLHPTLLHDYNYVTKVQSSRRDSSSRMAESGDQGTERRSAINTEEVESSISENPPGGEQKSTPTVVKSQASQLCSEVERTAMSAVIVQVYNRRTGKAKLVYCFLDSLSNGSFISDELRRDLGCRADRTTSVRLITLSGAEENESMMVDGLEIRSIDGNDSLRLPALYCRQTLPVTSEDIFDSCNLHLWPHLSRIVPELPTLSGKDIPVGLILGQDVPKALEPHEVIMSQGEKSPYALRTKFGWSVCGPLGVSSKKRSKLVSANFTAIQKSRDMELIDMLRSMYCTDFIERSVHEVKRSREDDEFMKIMNGKYYQDGRYFLPLPIRNENNLELPDNRDQAYRTAMRLRDRLLKSTNRDLKGKYVSYMEELVNAGHASVVHSDLIQVKNRWYVNFHDVNNPQKPDKFRLVFNASKDYDGHSLNGILLQGPVNDLTSTLIGVLLRFRQHPHAFTADVKGMFHQTRVPVEQRKYLRFLWWNNPELEGEPIDFELTVHLFGAASSPSCANLALRSTAIDNSTGFTKETVRTVLDNFYVDDVLKSLNDKARAKVVAKELCDLLDQGGFTLTKFRATDKEILDQVPAERLAESGSDKIEIKTKITESSAHSISALGIRWDIDSDLLEFRLDLKDHQPTRRGMLSMLAAIYDPLGLAAPFLLKGKRLLQQLSSKHGWDDTIPSAILQEWMKWRTEMCKLKTVKLHRCVKPIDFGVLQTVQIHAFSDASDYGYGVAIYLRLEDDKKNCCVSLLMGKSRVTPLKGETIPRSELVAAVNAAELSSMVQQELNPEYKEIERFLWTDSTVVLGYLNNSVKRFKTFEANRIRKCLLYSEPEMWHHVPSQVNPADLASRGMKPVDANHTWFKGPEFLWKDQSQWKSVLTQEEIPDTQIEETTILTAKVREPEMISENAKSASTKAIDPMVILKIVESKSDWNKAKSIIATWINSVLRWKKSNSTVLNVESLQHAQTVILKCVQMVSFEVEIKRLKLNGCVPKNSAIEKLDPYLDAQGLLRVGGRLQKSDCSEEVKHPVILPKNGHVTDIILRYFHESTAHGGRYSTMNRVRTTGFWIVSLNARVRQLVHTCKTCRHVRGSSAQQKMSNLPEDRLTESPPFTYVGVDMFGPYLVKNGRKEWKVWCALFTCLVSRAVHLELVSSMDTDGFVNALRRFIARRGPIRVLRSDNGTNFKGCQSEFTKSFNDINDEEIKTFLLKQNCDYAVGFNWKFNTPASSHHGGVWERMIRTARRVLNSLLLKHPHQLTYESLLTLTTEVEAIINSRPLTTICDSVDALPLAPINLLTQKSNVILPPPGVYENTANLYCRRQWRRVQYLANQFWTRFRKEVLVELQSKKKWTNSSRNFKIGDIVLLKDDSMSRNDWPMAKVVDVFPDRNGLVRSARLRLGRTNLNNKPKYLVRPIVKFVLLIES